MTLPSSCASCTPSARGTTAPVAASTTLSPGFTSAADRPALPASTLGRSVGITGWWAKPVESIGPSKSASRIPARAVRSSPYKYKEDGSPVWHTTSSSGEGVAVGGAIRTEVGGTPVAFVALGDGVRVAGGAGGDGAGW